MLRYLNPEYAFLCFLLWSYAMVAIGMLTLWGWHRVVHWLQHRSCMPSKFDFERWGKKMYRSAGWVFLLPDSTVDAYLAEVNRLLALSLLPQGIQVANRFDESDLRHVPSTPPAPPTEAQILAGALSGGRHHDARGHVLSGCAVRAAIQMEEAGLEPAALVGSMTMVQSEPTTMYPARVEEKPKPD